MSEDEIIKIVAYVGISKVRSNVLRFVGDDLRYPSQIAKNLNIRIQHVSTALKELKEKNFLNVLMRMLKLVDYTEQQTKENKLLIL